METYFFVESKINQRDYSRILVLDVVKFNEKLDERIIIHQKNVKWVNNAFTAVELQSVNPIPLHEIKTHTHRKFTYKGISFTGFFLHMDKINHAQVATFFADIKDRHFNAIMLYIPIKKNGFKRKYSVELIQEELN